MLADMWPRSTQMSATHSPSSAQAQSRNRVSDPQMKLKGALSCESHQTHVKAGNDGYIRRSALKSRLTSGAEQAQCHIGIAAVKTPSHSLSPALNMKS